MAFRPPYVALGLLAAVACRTAADPPVPPAPSAAPAPAAPASVTPAPATPAAATPAPAPPVAATPEAVSFEASVKPLLARTCTPCHVPGGRMYERMPFDQPEVVLSHKEGVLRRLKNPDDHDLVARWFTQHDKS
jgi:hypothetical protein